MSIDELIPHGLFEPVSWRNKMWTIVIAVMIKGKMKWKAKNRVSVGLSTEKPPQIHWTNISPISGKAERRLVITVAPQNDICPHGNT